MVIPFPSKTHKKLWSSKEGKMILFGGGKGMEGEGNSTRSFKT